MSEKKCICNTNKCSGNVYKVLVSDKHKIVFGTCMYCDYHIDYDRKNGFIVDIINDIEVKEELDNCNCDMNILLLSGCKCGGK